MKIFSLFLLLSFALPAIVKADATPSPTAVVTPGFEDHSADFELSASQDDSLQWTRFDELEGVNPAGFLTVIAEASEAGFECHLKSTGNGFFALKAGNKRYFELVSLDDSIEWKGNGILRVFWKTRIAP